MKKSEYTALCDKRAARSPVLRDCLTAGLVGGGISAGGEALRRLFLLLGSDEKTSFILVSVTLVAIAAFLTGIGVFDSIARRAGAGTLVPITGFANAVVSPALDNKSEGLVLGVGAKIFTVAGPVLLFGTLAGVLYGIVYFLAGILL